jgi:hypothetical protein
MNTVTSPIQASTLTPVAINWEAITPARALLWIKNTYESDFEQRVSSDGVIKKYVGEMSRGDWHSHTADIVRLGISNGMEVVVDGMHRLKAIAKSNVPFDMFVARNVPLDAFKYIDQGNNRTLKDVMDVAGWANSTTLSSTGRYLWVHEETGTPFGSVRAEHNLSAGSLFDWVESHRPDLRREWASHSPIVIAVRKKIKMSESIMFFLWMKMSAADHELTEGTFAFLSDPMDRTIPVPNESFRFAVEVIDDLQYEMKRLKLKGMKTRSDEHRDPCTSALIYAWNCARKGKSHRTKQGFKTALKKATDEQKWTIA